MIYDQKNSEKLDENLFKNPTSEYRGAPFWAWNCKLEKDELLRQIEIFKKMGFGGAHMHVRTGLETPYLSPEFMQLIKSATEKFKSENMLAWLYDEDRWPSGAAGGYVTKYPEYRQKYLLFTAVPYKRGEVGKDVGDSSARANRSGNGTLVARYGVTLDGDGFLKEYKRLSENENYDGKVYYAYAETPLPGEWFNNQTYVNTLSKEAIDKFIEVTYEAYKGTIGEDFGKSVPAIFTDEPQFSRKTTLDYASVDKDITLPWADDIPDTFKKEYGEDLLEKLPELVWEVKNGVSVTRYRFHDHIAERFATAFADNCGKWCRDNGLMLTGHMMEEPTLKSQTAALGEAMRSYRSFGMTGVDMLCDRYEYTTVKQAASAANQEGLPGVVSELYGVTNWDFDFRGHKTQGDWQAALGVTTRVPHLSWVSMKGEAKRDYPASINYQVPWHEKYSYVEDHFSRIATALTRGKPSVHIGVIHPIESYWLHWGPDEQTRLIRDIMDDNFSKFIEWMIFGTIDFDYICESNLPRFCDVGGAPLKVGRMEYDVIIVPQLETIRSTTLERLEAFKKAGGRLIFLGTVPTYVDALVSDRAKELAEISENIPFNKSNLLSALESEREVEIRASDGKLTDNYITRMREDNGAKWLFIANGKKPQNPDVPERKDVKIKLYGKYRVTLYDTLTGEIKPFYSEIAGNVTEIYDSLYEHDSRLFLLENAEPYSEISTKATQKTSELTLPDMWEYTADEENVLLLDMAEYCLDDGNFKKAEEILRADNNLRAELGWTLRGSVVAQPWVIPDEPARHIAHLKYTFSSEIDYVGAYLALEDGDKAKIIFNGQTVENEICGYFTDKSINKIKLPKINKGENILFIDYPYSERSNLENIFILGDFGVECIGKCTKITARPEKIALGDLTCQHLPFYGSSVTYTAKFESTGGDITVNVPKYRGGLVTVYLDGKDVGNIVYSPYNLKIENVKAGKHTLSLKIYGNRVNCFGPLHLCDPLYKWIGPVAWRTEGTNFSYQYNLKPFGILNDVHIYETTCK